MFRARGFASSGSCCVPCHVPGPAPAAVLCHVTVRCHRIVPGRCNVTWPATATSLAPATAPGTRSTSQMLPRNDPVVPVQRHKSCPGTILVLVQRHKSCLGTILVPVPRHESNARTLLDAATGAARATGRSSKAAGRCNRCCWSHWTLLQGCWTLQQVLLELQEAPARMLAATCTVGVT